MLFVILMRLAFSQEPFRLRSSGLSLLSLSGSERQRERERERREREREKEREREREREKERERGGGYIVKCVLFRDCLSLLMYWRWRNQKKEVGRDRNREQ